MGRQGTGIQNWTEGEQAGAEDSGDSIGIPKMPSFQYHVYRFAPSGQILR